jgi:hypothetical protein
MKLIDSRPSRFGDNWPIADGLLANSHKVKAGDPDMFIMAVNYPKQLH